MTKGDGTIQPLGPGKWRVFVSAGKDPVTGKYQRVTRTVNGTKVEARKVRDQLRRELEDGLKVEGDKLTFSEFASQYCEMRQETATVKPSGLAQEKRMLEFMSEIIGSIPLKRINAQVVESLYPEIRRRREAQGRRCGNTTLHAYHVLLKAVLRKAVDYDYIARNPCDKVTAPKFDKQERTSLTAKEAETLLEKIDKAENAAYTDLLAKEARQRERGNETERHSVLVMTEISRCMVVRVGLASGMRQGEILRTVWGNVDFAAGTVIVPESKTEAGRRTVALDADTMAHLARWRKVQADLLATIGIAQNGATPVFCDAVGGFINTQNFGAWWRDFRKKAGFPSLRFHELRHTQATLLLAQGVDVKTVQERLGHSDASLTLNWYAHAVPENDRRAAQLIGELFRQKPKEAIIIPMPKTA